MAGIAQTLIDLILVPGSSLRLVPVINVSLALLVLFIIVAGMYLDIGTIHVVVLASLAFGLFLSVNWFVYEFDKVRKSQVAEASSAVAYGASATTNASIKSD